MTAKYYRRKPQTPIRAVQVSSGDALGQVKIAFPECDFRVSEEHPDGTTTYVMHTSHGWTYLDEGDWVAEAPAGDYYPIKSSSFNDMYEQISGVA